MSTKKVFISDLHMNDERALHATETKYPYGWLRANIPILVAFLDEQLRADGVEVIILGDMFDAWTVAADLDPGFPSSAHPFYARTCETADNKPVVERLQALAKEGRFTYVGGNHDMTTSKDYMESTFPGIRWVGSAEPALRVYKDGQVVAQHSHEFGPFCATDSWTVRPDTMPQYLPMGYYMARAVTHKVGATGVHEQYLDIVERFTKEVFKGNTDIAEDVMLSVAGDSGMDESSKINMGGGVEVYVGDVGKVYADMIEEWGRHLPTSAGEFEFVLGVDECMRQIYFKPGSQFRIAVCGHTHKPLFKTWGVSFWDRLFKRSSLPAEHVYANSGTWIDLGHPPTYVETEQVADENRHYVRLKSYAKDRVSKTMNEAYVPLGG